MSTEFETIQRTENRVTLEPPGRWKVVFFNDDSTPVDYVVEVLVAIFGHDADSANEIAMTIHASGRGVAGVYVYEIAEQKSSETLADSRSRGYSLQVELEKE
jgi:ATP-dependent Clp protease adaptor protein ClpS|tara:strand:+ start:3978 stop:4283 length:306 start_codon:yes stop_codon:yes gene_type:complete